MNSQKKPHPPPKFRRTPQKPNQNMQEYTEILAVLQELRKEVEQLKSVHRPRVSKPPRIPCKGVTGKGTPCRNSSQPGHEYCRMHGERAVRPDKPKRVKKDPKPKKIQPEHTHEIGEAPTESCPLCDTHGDVMNPHLPESSFEGDEDIEDRLRRLLETENLDCIT